MTAISFLILALANWRITALLYFEDGPYLIFARLRRRAGVYYDTDNQRQGDNEIAKAFNCPACLSVWVGGAVALAYRMKKSITAWLVLPLALSTVAIIIETHLSKEETNG